MKVDAQIEEKCRRIISYLQGYSCPKLYCKTWTEKSEPTANTEQFYAEYGARLKNFHSSSNVLCICPSLFETNLNKAKYSIYEKLLTVLNVAGIQFSATLKALVLGNLFKLYRLVVTISREVCHLGIKMKKDMTIVIFFSLSPMANCPCECDGKSNKLE